MLMYVSTTKAVFMFRTLRLRLQVAKGWSPDSRDTLAMSKKEAALEE